MFNFFPVWFPKNLENNFKNKLNLFHSAKKDKKRHPPDSLAREVSLPVTSRTCRTALAINRVSGWVCFRTTLTPKAT